MTSPLCIHDLAPESCGFCRAARTPPKRPDLGPWFTAGFDSDCDGTSDDCEGTILEGEQARADGEGGYLCRACGEEAEGG
jgi:hypothetical protein